MSVSTQTTFDQAIVGVKYLVTGISVDQKRFPALFNAMQWLVEGTIFPFECKGNGQISATGYPRVTWPDGRLVFLQYFNYERRE
jgi:hypothetical protein